METDNLTLSELIAAGRQKLDQRAKWCQEVDRQRDEIYEQKESACMDALRALLPVAVHRFLEFAFWTGKDSTTGFGFTDPHFSPGGMSVYLDVPGLAPMRILCDLFWDQDVDSHSRLAKLRLANLGGDSAFCVEQYQAKDGDDAGWYVGRVEHSRYSELDVALAIAVELGDNRLMAEAHCESHRQADLELAQAPLQALSVSEQLIELLRTFIQTEMAVSRGQEWAA